MLMWGEERGEKKKFHSFFPVGLFGVQGNRSAEIMFSLRVVMYVRVARLIQSLIYAVYYTSEEGVYTARESDCCPFFVRVAVLGMQARAAEKKKNKYAEKLADLMVSSSVAAAGVWV